MGHVFKKRKTRTTKHFLGLSKGSQTRFGPSGSINARRYAPLPPVDALPALSLLSSLGFFRCQPHTDDSPTPSTGAREAAVSEKHGGCFAD